MVCLYGNLGKRRADLRIPTGSFNFFLSNGTDKVHHLKSQIKMVHGIKKKV